jgi:ABC-type nitrate/sulfonate/bicarbonate transport system ATPase subunit
MLSPSSRSCSPWKRFWFSRLNISPAGAHERLDVNIRQKSYRSAAGRSLHVLGPSGCGKTTLLRIISGLDHDFQGRVALPAAGRLGMVFQEPRLLAWRTVEQNVRLAAPRMSDDELAALFEMLELTAHRNHYPRELSLGLARRVALARAFAVDPDLLLLDEHFIPVVSPRGTQVPEQTAALRAEITRRLKP